MKIFITGEKKLVDEYALACANKNHNVSILYNSNNQEIPQHEQIVAVKKPAKEIELAIELTNIDCSQKKTNIEMLDATLAPGALILCSTVTVNATECARWCAAPHLIAGIDAFPTLLANKLVEVAIPVQHNNLALDPAKEFFSSLEKEIAEIDDRIGMVTPRIIVQIVNEACYEVMQNVARPDNIDEVAIAGNNYPKGPFQWLDAIGADQIIAVLEALHRDSGEERYAVAPLLRKIAVAGEFWKKNKIS